MEDYSPDVDGYISNVCIYSWGKVFIIGYKQNTFYFNINHYYADTQLYGKPNPKSK